MFAQHFMDLFDIKPESGQLRINDSLPYVAINKPLARQLGFNNPEDALNTPIRVYGLTDRKDGVIAAILPDYYNGDPVSKSSL